MELIIFISQMIEKQQQHLKYARLFRIIKLENINLFHFPSIYGKHYRKKRFHRINLSYENICLIP